jgi:hypothetical protein
MSNRFKFLLLFTLLLVFRTVFSFSKSFFAVDELQTFLIGLKFYCTGAWPYFGPDLIVTETGFYNQIPGALEGLLIGGPLYLFPIPEASLLMLNLLSLSAIAFLSWYIHKRLPAIPLWFTFTWIALLPWTLHESTRLINTGFLLFGSVLFFIGFMEAVPPLTLKWLTPLRAFALMGLGLFWDMQFHFSWILLPPFVAFAFWSLRKEWQKVWLPAIIGFGMGGLPLAALILPTLVKYGWFHGLGGAGTSRFFCPENFLAFFTILFRYLSFSCFELPRFLGPGTPERLAFFKAAPWLIPPGLLLIPLGWIQTLVLLYYGWIFRGGKEKNVVALALAAFLLVYVSFWFTSKDPLAHIYYILFPVITLYSFYAWNRLANRRRWRILGVACLIAGFWLEGGYAVKNLGVPPALYSDRPKAAAAIREKNFHLLGERRPGSFY